MRLSPLLFFFALLFFFSAAPLPAAKPQKTAAPKTQKTKIDTDYSQRDDVKAWAAAFGEKQGIQPLFLLDTLKDARRAPRIIDLMDAPVKTPPLWFEYAPRFLNAGRIEGGVEFWQTNEAALDRAAAFFGVSAEIVVAVIGVETHYGRNTGGFRVIDALATLAFDYPRRADYFLGELQEFFLLTLDDGVAPTVFKGSYAGAMGIAQFMPRSYRHYAVDFDGDGRVDLWQPADAVGSVAFYLQEHGWHNGAPILTPLSPTAETRQAIAAHVENGLSEAMPWRDWQALGVRLDTPHDAPAKESPAAPAETESVSLLKLDGDDGALYFAAHDNFRVIMRYNKSRLYASAVTHLANKIKEARIASGKPSGR